VRYVNLVTVISVFLCSVGLTGVPAMADNAQPVKAAGSTPVQSPPEAGSVGSPAQDMVVRDIPPLYKEPKLAGEGVWVKEDLSGGHDPAPIVYRTFYRPSERFPNAIAHMMLLNMKRMTPELYLGSAESYRKGKSCAVADSKAQQAVAVTNALWQTKHAGKGGIIFRGEVLKKMEPGVATIIVYKNGSMDILEWNDALPVADIQDARQLKHLIVNDGKVVTSITKRGQPGSAEIGLGSLLNEDRPTVATPAPSPEEKPSHQLNITSGDLWYLANRSAFGIRPDGNLVFAIGHHISTTDLAKALVLAGCVRGLHGDANPGNCVGILYFTDGIGGKVVRKAALSPKQDKSAFDRYLKGSYPKDYFAYFRRTSQP
jgi:hypothetical protein